MSEGGVVDRSSSSSSETSALTATVATMHRKKVLTEQSARSRITHVAHIFGLTCASRLLWPSTWKYLHPDERNKLYQYAQ